MDVETGRESFEPVPVPYGARTIEWSPDGRYLERGIPGPMIWDARTGELLDELPGHPWIDAIAWSPDSSTLATAGDEASGTKVRSIREGIADERLTLSSTETRQGVRSVGSLQTARPSSQERRTSAP